MKPKELFQRILNKDGYVIYRNTGIISFDKKSNFIQGNTGGGSFIMIPDEVAELLWYPENPYFEESSGDAAAMFAFVGAEPTSLSFTIDELTVTTIIPPEDDDIIQVIAEPVTQEALYTLHELGIDYFDDKIGQYITLITIVISNMEGYTPLAAGEHPYSLSANSEEVISGNFTVE